mgnify:CR=1 FL=1
MSIHWDAIPKQTLLHENGEFGDCWRCCIAAVLGMPAESVPHFGVDVSGKPNRKDDADTQRWLAESGYCMLYANSVACRRSLWMPMWYGDDVKKPPIIVCGPTIRSKTDADHHAVVEIGSELVYDPHPSEAGLLAVSEEYIIFKPYA